MKFIYLVLVSLLLLTCLHGKKDKVTLQSKVIEDTTPRVTGIGGIFFKSQDPQAARAWYGDNLGLAIHPWGSPFEFRNANRPEEINYLSWGPFTEDAENFEETDATFMINYRVQNLAGLLKNLKAKDIIVVNELKEYPHGKFAHILDLEGNKIELWEPNDAYLTSIGGATTK